MQEDESKIKWSQFLAGDNEAYCWIYKVYIQMLFRYGHNFTSDTELIKDCIQDVFTGLYKNRKQLITPKNIKVYLLVSLKNSLINALYREDRYTSYNHETVSFTLGLTVEEQYVTDELYTNQQMNYQSAQNLIQRSLKKIRDLYGPAEVFLLLLSISVQ